MAWDIDTVLKTEGISRVQKSLSEYKFIVGETGIEVTIRLFQHIGGPDVSWEQSHRVKAPGQVGPYITSKPWADGEAYALHRAVDGIMSYYNAAVSAGHEPDAKWLIPNPRFGKPFDPSDLHESL